ncbi:MAG: hypothetical protein Q9227_001558 [Pyrenula ochraceoflavens]
MTAPTPSRLPQGVTAGLQEEEEEPRPSERCEKSTATLKRANIPCPLLRLHVNDVSHPATASFINLVDATKILTNSISHIINHLYPGPYLSHVREVRSVTLVLRSYDGLAMTFGIPLDDAHKEIHFNLDYIQKCAKDDSRRRHEIIGVIQHEMVHCFQHNAQGTAPGGLIEGIADYVRLKANLAPPHWERAKIGEKWDDGYQKTAYFLEWLDEAYGEGSVAKINEALRDVEYSEELFWTTLFKKNVKTLWNEYRDSRKGKDPEDKGGHEKAIPTCA